MLNTNAETIVFHSNMHNVENNNNFLKEQKIVLIEDITKLNDDLISLSNKLDVHKKNYDMEIKTLIEQKNVVNIEANSKKKEYNSLKQACDNLEPLKKHLDLAINEKQQQLLILEKKVNNNNSLIEQYKNQTAEAKKMWEDIIKNLVIETERLEKNKQAADLLEESKIFYEENLKIIDKQRQEIIILVKNKQELLNEEIYIKQSLEKLKDQSNKFRNDEIELIKRRNDAELELAKIELELKSSIKQIDDNKLLQINIQKEIEESLIKKQNYENESIQLQIKNNNLLLSMDVLKQNINQKEVEIEILRRDIDDYKKNLCSLIENIVEKEKKIELLVEKNDKLLAEKISIETQNTFIQTNLFENKNKLSDLEDNIEKNDKLLILLKKEIEDLNILQKELIYENENLEQKKQELEKVMQNKYTEINNVEKQKKELQDLCLNISSQISENKEIMKRTNMELENIKNKKIEVLKELDTLKINILSDKNLAKELIDKKKELILENNKLHDDILLKQDKIREIERNINSCNIEIKSKHTQIIELNSDIKELEDIKNNTIKNKKQSEQIYLEIQNKIIILKQEEASIKTQIHEASKSEKAYNDRAIILENQENELLKRLDNIRNEINTKENLRRNIQKEHETLFEKNNYLEKTIEQGLKKKESLINLLKKESSSIKNARLRLQEIEDLRIEKLKDLENLRTENLSNVNISEDDDLECNKLKLDAEKTLESIKKRLQNINNSGLK